MMMMMMIAYPCNTAKLATYSLSVAKFSFGGFWRINPFYSPYGTLLVCVELCGGDLSLCSNKIESILLVYLENVRISTLLLK